MKYYYRKSKQGHRYTRYIKGDIPTNKSIYGFYYNVNGLGLSYQTPIKGVIANWFGDYFSMVFIPYKRTEDGKGYLDELDTLNFIPFNSLMYADTYKEACEMFNELVEKRIAYLNRSAEEAKQHLISPKKVNKKNKKRRRKLNYGKEN